VKKEISYEVVKIGIKNTGEAPIGREIFYQCGICQFIVPSTPKDSIGCLCNNIGIDKDLHRLFVKDYSNFIVLRKNSGSKSLRGGWRRKYFWFLVEKYGFTYEAKAEFQFQNPKMLVQISLGPKTPRIYFLRRGDDPAYMIPIERIIEFLDGHFPYRDTLKYELEENVVYYADLFCRYADRLINDFEKWWFPAQLFFYKQYGGNYLYPYLKQHGMIE
jgi:hypothetical protein